MINDLIKLINEDNTIQLNSSPYYNIEEFNQLINNKITDHISLFNLNIQSYRAKENILKIYLNQINNKLNFKFDILTFQETWLSNNIENEANIKEYHSIFKHRHTGMKGGGLAIYVLKKHNYRRRDDIKVELNKQPTFESLFIEIDIIDIKNKKHNFIIGTIYRIPHTSVNEFNNEIEILLQSLKTTNTNIIITGDFNINLMNINSTPSTNNFLDLMLAEKYLPQITLPTRITKTTATLIDNIFTKTSLNNQITSGIISTVISDHYPNFSIFPVQTQKQNSPKITFKRKFTKKNIEAFKTDLEKENWQNIYNTQLISVNDKWNYFISKYKALLDKNIPIEKTKFKKYKHKLAPWLTIGILTSIKTRDKLHRKLTKEKNEQKNTKLEEKYKTYQLQLKKIINIRKNQYWSEKIQEAKSDYKTTWKIINQLLYKTNKQTQSPKQMETNGKIITNTLEIADEFNTYFTDIGKRLTKNTPPINNIQKETIKSIDSIFITPVDYQEILKIVANMKNKLSTGPDDISPRIIKTTITSILKPLTYIINESLQRGEVPNSMKIAKVIPVYKKNDPNQFTNYRPISLLSSFSKILERTVHNRVFNFLQNKNLLNKSQYGFRTNHSTEQAIIEIQNNIIENFKNNTITAGIFLDLSKAFDCINHTILINKLENHGIRGNCLKWFKNYLSNRLQYVTLNKINSKTIPIDTGIPQGTILGPLLFIIYMNDLKTNHGTLISFADDTNLLYNDSNLQTLETKINQDLRQISNWLQINKLNLNVDKSKLLLFRKDTQKHNNQELNLTINNNRIKEYTETNFLGVILQNNLKWDKQYQKISNKTSQLNYIINKLKHSLSSKILTTIYNSLVLPHLNYGILSWYTPNTILTKRIITLQKKLIRNITCSKYNSHTEPLFRKLKLLKLNDIFKQKGSILYLKSINKETSHYIQEQLKPNNTYYTHNTRQAQNIRLNQIKSNYDKQSINYKIHHIVSELKHILNRNTSIYTNKINIKKILINKYNTECDIMNCYICNKIT